MSSTLSLFNPSEDLPPDFMLIMYGMRRAGKTTMLLHMLEQMKDRFTHHQVHVFSGTADENPAQWRNFPPGYVTADIANIDVHLGDILRQQQEQIREEVETQIGNKRVQIPGTKRKRGEEGVGSRSQPTVRRLGVTPAIQNDTNIEVPYTDLPASNDIYQLTDNQINELRREGKVDESRFPRRLIILDDVVSESSIRHSKNLNKLAISGRHIFITVIILSQAVAGSASVPPIIRRNSDYIMVVGYPRSINERKMIAEEYLTIGNERDAQEKTLRILKDVTQKQYRSFVIDVTNSTAVEYNQFLFQFGPVPPPPRNVNKNFKLGTRQQWEFQFHHGQREASYDASKRPKKPSKMAGRFSNPNAGGKDEKISRNVKPIYRSAAASESNPYAVVEFFKPIF
jgi:hypothetical protein